MDIPQSLLPLGAIQSRHGSKQSAQLVGHFGNKCGTMQGQAFQGALQQDISKAFNCFNAQKVHRVSKGVDIDLVAAIAKQGGRKKRPAFSFGLRPTIADELRKHGEECAVPTDPVAEFEHKDVQLVSFKENDRTREQEGHATPPKPTGDEPRWQASARQNLQQWGWLSPA